MSVNKRLVFCMYVPSEDKHPELTELHFRYLRKYSDIFTRADFILTGDVCRMDEMSARILSSGFNNGCTLRVVREYGGTDMDDGTYFKREVMDRLGEFDGLTFYACMKKYDVYGDLENATRWISAMYYFNLEHAATAEYCLLVNNGLTFGTLKRTGYGDNDDIRYGWRYSGSFMWINGQALRHYMSINGIEIPTCHNVNYSETCMGNIIPDWRLPASFDLLDYGKDGEYKEQENIDACIRECVTEEHYNEFVIAGYLM